MLVLQIVVQAKPLGGEMLADHRHPEIGAVLAAVALRDRKAQVSGGVGEIFHLSQQGFPFLPRQPAFVEIGARPFATMIEKPDVVVGVLDRLDLAGDEAVEFIEIGDEVGRQCKIQGSLSQNCLLVGRQAMTSCAPAEDYFPCHCGGRFSENAFGPST